MTRTLGRLIAPGSLTGLALAAVTAATVLGAAPAQATQTAVTPSSAQAVPSRDEPAGPEVVQTGVLSADAALRIADAAIREAARQKQRVTVAIVDRSGATRLVVKGDGAGPQTEESARRKAFTAVSFGKTTGELAKGLTGGHPSIADIPGTLFLAGGVPVASGGAPVAGVGVGGAPSGDIDEAIAQAGLKAVAGRLR
ncbi:heme-binding protein [Nonomuraea sp. SMC257]|uniref:Heme-binding protein n=1 Tax=Nonomuraea montanisoli TaxID=2741721 RepID=A0A7Y6I7K8_9ACTN|nr:heme-binding protein [Nonomuraea montanisoli]NUW33195.1 heme-binding protein [Nonomuraea montanisoli]